MTLTHSRLVALLALLALVFMLPLAVFLVRSRQDIRPRALSGAANFKLNADKTSVNAGDTFNVSVSLQLTNTSVRASGVDFTLLYDNSKLEVTTISPLIGSAWTDAPINQGSSAAYTGEGNGQYNYIRIALVSKKANADLPGGTVPLANISFRAIANSNGSALIKFPEDISVLQVVGSGI